MLRSSLWLLRALVVLNIAVGLLLLGLLAFTFTNEALFVSSTMKRFPDADAEGVLLAARWSLAFIGPVMVVAHILFRKLLAILASVADGDPFTPVNANRLQTVAWCLLALQLCDIGFGVTSSLLDKAAGEGVGGWSFGLTGWVAVLLVFVLARVFREGTRLRDEAELTI